MYLSTLCIGNQHYFFSIHFSILCAKRKKKKSSSKMQKKKKSMKHLRQSTWPNARKIKIASKNMSIFHVYTNYISIHTNPHNVSHCSYWFIRIYVKLTFWIIRFGPSNRKLLHVRLFEIRRKEGANITIYLIFLFALLSSLSVVESLSWTAFDPSECTFRTFLCFWTMSDDERNRKEATYNNNQ